MSNVIALRAYETPRWRAVIEYRTDNGPVDVEHLFEEIEELDGLIERGPDWNTMIRCTVTLAEPDTPELTIEQSAKQ